MELNWKRYFLPYVLERGRKYVREHRVESITQTKTGYEATVMGEEVYHVVIRMAGENIEQMECDCFYVKNKGEHCKHMAAVLYELEAMREQEEEMRRGQLPELEEMIGEMEKEEMQKFLFKKVQDSSEFDKELRLFLSSPVHAEELERRREEIDQIFLECEDREGLIDSQKSFLFRDRIRCFFEDKIEKMIDYGNEKAAFELISYMLDLMEKVKIEDSECVGQMVCDDAISYLDKILKTRDRALEKEIYEWISGRLSAKTEEDFEEKWYDFVLEHFTETLSLERKLTLLNEKIEKEEKELRRKEEKERKGKQEKDRRTEKEADWRQRRWREDVARRLQIMEQLSYPGEECEKYRIKFWSVPEIRQMEIQKKIQKQAYEDAEKMIEESVQMDQNLAEWQEKYCRWLTDLYQAQGRKKEYCEKMIEYFLVYHQDSKELWRKIRSTFDAKEWIIVREEILEKVQMPYFRRQILVEEKMFLPLIQELGNEKHLDSIDQYEQILRRKFPGEMLKLYADCLVHMVPSARGREKYKKMREHLEKMKKYPGGAEVVDQIVADWKKRYKQKRALMEELEKLS